MSMDTEVDQRLIPGLPDDVSLLCLLRVPVQSHLRLQGVSRKWRDLVNSAEFYEERKKTGTTKYYVCMLQALPNRSLAKHDSIQCTSSRVYGVSMYDEQQRVWERLPPVPELPEGLPLFSRLVAVSGKLVVFGGWNPSTWETVRSVYEYNFSTQTWSRCADMPTARSFFACGAIGNHVIVAGGHDNDKNALSTTEIYSIESDRWESLPRLREERDECSGVTLDGKFFVVSGYPTDFQGQFVKSAEVYDPASNTWTTIEDMWAVGSQVSSPGVLTALSGQLYALSGKQLVRYSAAKNSWSVLSSPPDGEKWDLTPVCVTAANNAIIVSGPSRSDEDHSYKMLVYQPAVVDTKTNNSGWEVLERDDQFAGVTQMTCSLEI